MGYKGNGCGPKGPVGKIIPDSLFGVCVVDACNNHAASYSKGGDAKDRRKADVDFLKAMLAKVEEESASRMVKSFRKVMAYAYYYTVRLFGHFLFEKQKK
jgi:hypothetical protein